MLNVFRLSPNHLLERFFFSDLGSKVHTSQMVVTSLEYFILFYFFFSLEYFNLHTPHPPSLDFPVSLAGPA